MPEYNMTDKEQIEAIKKWWKDYGKAITIAVIIGLAVGFGWRYWRQYRVQQSERASLIYQSMTIADYQKKPKLSEQFANQLITHYKSSPYATFAALWWAKEAVQKNNLAVALAKCQWVIKNSPLKSFQQIARIRAARIFLAQKKPKQALNLLAIVDDSTFIPLINAVKGDAYTALGQGAAAKKAYQAAKLHMSSSINTVDPLLNMKLAQPVP